MIGGVTGTVGYDNNTVGTVSNSYCITNTAYSYWRAMSSTSTDGRVSAEVLKTYASQLGEAYTNDSTNINNGYPVLKWQVEVNN